jgi:phosphoribosylformimino-5-aminoimidazole carboxamide ribotide isomerase
VVVAADVRGEEVQVRGWTAGAGLPVSGFLAGLAPLPLAAVLVTDVSREGQLLGADTDTFARLAQLSPHPLIAAGGVAGAADLPPLASAGVAGVVLGMALYTGALEPASVAATYAKAT